MLHAGVTMLLALALSGSAWAGGDLVLRARDAQARPGQTAAIVLSTYEPVPIEQGQICLRVGAAPNRLPGAAMVFAELGDATVSVVQAAQGDLLVSFLSPSGTINTQDGPMVVLYFDVPANAVPGTTLPITVDLGGSALQTPQGQTLTLDPRAGLLTIVDAAAPYVVAVDGDRVAPGQRAFVSVDTVEPFPLTMAEFGLRYDPAFYVGVPQVRARSKTTQLQVQTDTHVPGLLRVRVRAADPWWNEVPGSLFEVSLRTRANMPAGSVSPITLDPALTRLRHAAGHAVPLLLEPGDVELR